MYLFSDKIEHKISVSFSKILVKKTIEKRSVFNVVYQIEFYKPQIPLASSRESERLLTRLPAIHDQCRSIINTCWSHFWSY